MLVDAGSTSSAPGSPSILNAVQAIMGTNTFSTIVITHPDADHCNLISTINAAQSPTDVHIGMAANNYSKDLQNWFAKIQLGPVKATIHSYPENYYETKPQQNFSSGQAKVYILAANASGDKNTHSLVLSIDYKGYTLLLTGDATSTTERFILKNWDQPSIASNLLCFGHHGSNHSTSKNFLNSVVPDIGVFSASAQHMGYGHPRCSVYDSALLLVDQNGKPANISVQQHRIECWVPSQYVYDNTQSAIFLTATQGNIQYATDGKEYEVWVDTL